MTRRDLYKSVVVGLALVGLLILFGQRVSRALPPPPPPVADQPAVLRRLEIRLHADLDKTHPVVGGERYRTFECREVPRKRPIAGKEAP